MQDKNKISAQRVSQTLDTPNSEPEVRRSVAKKRVPLFYYLIFSLCGIYLLWEIFNRFF